MSGGFISASAGVLGADHAALWLDIPLEVLQLTTFLARKTQARRLKTENPQIQDAYINNYTSFCLQHKLIERGQKLWEMVQEGQMLSTQQIAEFENIDALRVQGMNIVGKNVGSYKWGTLTGPLS